MFTAAGNNRFIGEAFYIGTPGHCSGHPQTEYFCCRKKFLQRGLKPETINEYYCLISGGWSLVGGSQLLGNDNCATVI